MHQKGCIPKDDSFQDLWVQKYIDSFQDPCRKNQETKPQIYGPVNEARFVISDPQMAKLAPQPKEQPVKAKGSPPKGSRFNPIYIEPGSTSIKSTKDLQVLFPDSFDCILDMLGEYDIKTD